MIETSLWYRQIIVITKDTHYRTNPIIIFGIESGFFIIFDALYHLKIITYQPNTGAIDQNKPPTIEKSADL